METVKTATGKTFESDYLSSLPLPERLYIRIVNVPVATVAAVFSDPRETVQIWYENRYFAHFTKLLGIIPEGNAVRVTLGKE